MADDKRIKEKINIFSDNNNHHLKDLLCRKNASITKNDLLIILEHEHGQHLAEIIQKEWAINQLKEIIDTWEYEHSNSLALLFENENQKLMLEELNTKLTNAAIMMEKDLRLAGNVQRSLLISSPPKSTNYDIAFLFQPSASVSGDFYDFYTDKNNNLKGMVLADVSGHGIASSLLTALTKPIFFRTFMDNDSMPLEDILIKINKRIIEEMEEAENFLTAVLLRFKDKEIEYVNAAHPDIIYKDSSNNTVRHLKPKDKDVQGPILGLTAIQSSYQSYNFTINKDDIVVIFTDCLNENRNLENKEFGEENLFKILQSTSAENTAQEILDKISKAFYDHMGKAPIKDDLTISVIKKK